MALYQTGSSAKRKPHVRPALFTLLMVFALLIAACGGPAETPEEKASSLTILASPNGNFAARNFNPYVEPNAGAMFGAQGMIYETLIYMNRYNGEITPMLASDYKLADDASSLSFTIRDGVTWSDGEPFTVEDVRYTFEDLIRDTEGFDTRGLWTNILESVAVEGNTITLTFQQPNSTAVWDFGQTYIVPKHVWSKVADLSLQYLNEQPVGTGPYTLDQFSEAAYTLKRNASYWQEGKPQIEELVYIATNDNTAAGLQISQGNVDWAGIGWTPQQDADYIDADPEHRHHWFPGSNTVMLYLNLTMEPFNDVNVRKAISLAINREEIQQRAAPYAQPAHPSALLPAQSDFISSQYKDTAFEQDTAEAESLLQDAGFEKNGDGIYEKNGKPLSFTMQVPNGWSDWQLSLDTISTQLAAVGIEATVEATATPDIYTQALNEGTFEAAISWTNTGPTPYQFLNDWLRSTRTWEEGKPMSGPTNWQHWQDEETDKLLDQYLTSADPAVQQEAIQGLTEIIVEQLPAIPINYNAAWYQYTTYNAEGWPSEDDPYAYGSPFNAPDNAQIVMNLTPVK